jgi:hypothetical protein
MFGRFWLHFASPEAVVSPRACPAGKYNHVIARGSLADCIVTDAGFYTTEHWTSDTPTGEVCMRATRGLLHIARLCVIFFELPISSSLCCSDARSVIRDITVLPGLQVPKRCHVLLASTVTARAVHRQAIAPHASVAHIVLK